MNYQETIHYLFTRLPMFSKIGTSAYKKDLHNIRILEQANDNPHRKFKTIHIAGTNGKGSTSHMLAAILQEAGYKTGLYTSPHLKDFRERIRINGEMIPPDVVVAFTEKMQTVIPVIEPSFFEITVAMAFEWFALQEVNIAVVEVGLGGRLDSTNIITPEISVITNIGWDHMNILGDSLEKIATEKAGIIKEGIPVVIGETIPETKKVFQKASLEKNAPIYYANELQQVISWEQREHLLSVTIQEAAHLDAHQYLLDLNGFYQAKNIGAVLQTIRLLQQKGYIIPETAISAGLAHTRKLTGLHGRWEQISDHPRVILDVGHNEDGIKAICEQLELTNYNHLHIVMGIVKDKDISKVLSLLPQRATYYFTQASIPRALPAEQLQTMAAGAGLTGKIFKDVNSALKAAKNAASDKDLVLVCGSVFVVGEVNR
ncbi:bifunctional folylpolyglutamate synthase/dihydrofolate synthase [Flavihumibacter profundi]|jgi:dihydrofolate synthase / folylpolyglutamate synthase|uniref:bifunctional folylpolyglutamate synthase/dihydrofolate synthase n=1 Tax=Flavihumibacter profundi TaxID=2716883 RepID=UPI001CC6BE53|nr:folylpolyglutamate synthase/dihydrofolate synthase family protein [Flavihumibacter profundi]MBZ5855880.1 bifunctional folylpolyglutamate synthase/dihydrofolate synthase [Flavihumibacter profundi]